MTTLPNPLLHEVFVQWPAWQMVAGYVTTSQDPRTVDPAHVEYMLGDMSTDRLRRVLHLLVGYQHADTLEEAADLLTELREMAIRGERPRFASEASLTFTLEELR